MKLIQTTDYLLLIDVEAEIQKGGYAYQVNYEKTNIQIIKIESDFQEKIANDKNGTFTKYKIVAYHPLTKEAEELDLPLLPPFEDYSLDKAKEFAIDKFKGTFTKYPRGGKISNEGIQEIIKVSVETGYKFSTKAAQSKQFSLEDMKKAIETARTGFKDYPNDSFKSINNYIKNETNKIIQSLSTQQLPKEFIPKKGFDYGGDGALTYVKTLNSEGKEVLVGTYKY